MLSEEARVKIAQGLTVLGAVLMIGGAFSPLVNGSIKSTEWNTFFVAGPPQNLSAFGMPVLFALIAVSVMSVVVSFSSSRRLLLWLGAAAVLAVVWSFRYCLRFGVFSFSELFADAPVSNSIFGYGWLILIPGAFCVVAAALVAQHPVESWSELRQRLERLQGLDKLSRSSDAQNTPRPAVQDFGPCAQCGTNNAHLATKCHKCGAILPWTQIKPQRVKAGTILPNASTNKRRFSLDFGAFVVGFFCLVMPIIGYFVYRSYAEHGSDRTAVAGWCTLIGFVLLGLRVLIRLADVIVP